jgi:hypothetical protein
MMVHGINGGRVGKMKKSGKKILSWSILYLMLCMRPNEAFHKRIGLEEGTMPAQDNEASHERISLEKSEG